MWRNLIKLGFLFVVAGCADVSEPVRMSSNNVDIETALNAAGESTGLFFTIETDGRDVDHCTGLATANVFEPVGLRTADDVRAYLKDQLPNVVLIRDKREPRILHAIDGSLVNLVGYVMSDKFTMNFSGTPSDLLDMLRIQTHGRVGPEVVISAVIKVDYLSHVDVVAARTPLREALSCFVSLKGCRPVLWKSYSNKSEDSVLRTFVEFTGRAR